MPQSLIFLRVLGAVIGLALVVHAFLRFRSHRIRRTEFLFRSFLGVALTAVAVEPDVVNVIAGMMALRDRQFGRLIALLLLSSLALWILVIGLRGKDEARSVQFDLLVRRLACDRFLEDGYTDSIHEVTTIMPALNEEQNLEDLLPRFPKEVFGRKLSVLLVDDGSTDGTAAVARAHGCTVLSNLIRRGGGAALRLGYDVAATCGAEVIVTMDADGQHRPEEIERLVEPILEGKADIVIGSRIIGDHQRDSWVRWLGIHLFSAVINLLAGTRISDCSNGFRAFRVAALEQVQLRQDQFHTAELIIDAARHHDLRITEVPVTVLSRQSGESKKGRNLSYGVNFSKTIVKTWLRD